MGDKGCWKEGDVTFDKIVWKGKTVKQNKETKNANKKPKSKGK